MISLITEWQYRGLRLAGAWHLAYYIPEEHEIAGSLSSRIIEFKNSWPRGTVDRWCQWAIDDLAGANLRFDFILRALGSKELIPREGRPLDMLGNRIATWQSAVYAPAILNKVRETASLHTLHKLDERRKEMANAYLVVDRSWDLNGRHVLLLDDVTTTNTTLTEILRALRVEWPRANYSFLSLGRTSRNPDANKLIPLTYFS
jgi:hypothetical protein